MKNFISTIICFSLFFTVFDNTFSQNPAFDSLANEINRISMYKKTKSLELLDSLYKMAYNSPDSSLLIACCLYEDALLKERQGIIDTLLIDKINSRLAMKHLTHKEEALLLSALGLHLISEGEFAEAFTVQLQALNIFKKIDDKIFMARTLLRLGSVCDAINLQNLKEYYYSEAIKYITPENHEYLPIKMNIFNVALRSSNNESAIDSLFFLLETAENEGYEEIIPLLYLNIGTFILNSNPEKAFIYFTKMQSLDFDYPKLKATLFGNLGRYYFLKNDYLEALYHFKKAQEILEENKAYGLLPKLYSVISDIFEMQNQIDSALLYSRKNENIHNKLASNTIAIETHQKYITTYLEAKENELIIAEQKNALKQRHITIIVIVLVSVILMILLSLLYVHHQKLRKTSENNELTAKLELEQKQKKAEIEKHEIIVEANRREITTYSLLVLDKNQILKQIMELNTQIINNKENRAETAVKIDKIIKNNLNLDKEWDNFKIHFEKVHPNFFTKLKNFYSEITDDNLKLCAYIKIGFTNKQIAQIQNVEPSSVNIRRYRLKKKMGLSENEDLANFLAKL